MTRRYFVDNAPTATLTAQIDAAAVSVPLSSITGFPTAFPYVATIDIGTASAEQVRVTGAAGSTVTVVRNINGQGAFTHTAQATFNHTAYSADFDEANAHVNATTNVHGITGTFADTDTAQTLTNKTLDVAVVHAVSTAAQPGVVVTADANTDVSVAVKNMSGTTTMSVTAAGAVTAASAAVSGNTSVGGNATVVGTLGVTGATTLSGNASVGGTLGVTGATTLAALSATSVANTGNESVGGTLGVTGNSTLGGTLSVAGATTLHAVTTGAVTTTGGTSTDTLAASGGVTVGGAVTVTGNLATSANATVTGTLTVGGHDVVATYLTPVTDSNPGSVSSGFTNPACVARTTLNGKDIYLRLEFRNTSTISLTGSGNLPDTPCYTVNAAYRPTETVAGAWTDGFVTGTAKLATNGVVTLVASSGDLVAFSTTATPIDMCFAFKLA